MVIVGRRCLRHGANTKTGRLNQAGDPRSVLEGAARPIVARSDWQRRRGRDNPMTRRRLIWCGGRALLHDRGGRDGISHAESSSRCRVPRLFVTLFLLGLFTLLGLGRRTAPVTFAAAAVVVAPTVIG